MEEEKKVENTDEVKDMFQKTLEYQDEMKITEEENEGEKEIDTHGAEIFSPIATFLITGLSFLANFFYASFIAIAVGIVGLIVCKKKGSFLNNKILLLNVIATACAFFVSCLWVMIIIIG